MPQLIGPSVRGSLAVLLLLAVPLVAADGDPVGSGFAPFDQGGSNADTASAVVVQPDGKVIVVGTVTTGFNTWSPALARFLPDGTLDATFGSGGRVVDPLTNIGNNQTGAAALLLPTGRILVAGTLEGGPPGNSDFYVLRLLEDGSVDGTFGFFSGFTSVEFDLGGDGTDTLAAMTVDRSGRILLAGSVDVSPTDIDFGVVRLLAGGGLDTGFSGDGRATVPISAAGGIDGALAIAEHTTGGVVVGGATWTTDLGGHFDIALARLLGDGSLDGSFGSGGKVVMSWALGGTNNDFCWGLGIWPDGEIVAASDVATAANEWKWMLQRFSPTGTYLDGFSSTFCDSPAPPCPPPQDSPRALVLQGDGKILIAGFGSGPSGTRDFAVARFYRALGFDATFGAGGTRTYDLGWGIGTASDTGTAMAFDRDGRIVVAGSAEWSGLDTDFAWARFDSSYIFADGFDWPGGWRRWSSAVP